MKKPIVFTFCAAALAIAAEPARILIITGESDEQYHNWRETSSFVQQALERTGRFAIRRVEDPQSLTARALDKYDAAVLSYNGPRWGAAAETVLEEFVRSGKGLVSYHGVTYGPLMGTTLRQNGTWIPTEPWKAFGEMLGVTWPAPNIGHAPRHAFTVKLAGGDPITRGMAPEFIVNDELYHKMTHHPGIRVVATAFDYSARGGTGKNEPVAWTNAFGKGRVFHSTLGHDVNALYSEEGMALLARAVEWAATGAVTIGPAIALSDAPDRNAVRVLVVTGGHTYDPSFYTVFEGYRDLRWSHATSPTEAFAPGMKDRWDVVVLYDLHNEIGEAEAGNLREYVEAGKGVVALHHSIVDYTSWPWWYEEVIGGKYFEKAEGSHSAAQYKDDVPMIVRPVAGRESHPIVKGMGELVTVDECYRGMWHSPKITALMEITSEYNDKPAVYIGPQPNSHVVYIQLGHGTFTHRHPGYRKLVHNAIQWAAGRTK
jgi:type 1 glutamine amidotransferase